MARFRQFVGKRHPDLQFLFPLEDEEGNTYHSLEEANAAFDENRQIFHIHNLSSGREILDRFLGDDDWGLYPDTQDLRSELLKEAETMDNGQSVIVQGAPLMCKGNYLYVFGGFGKSVRGRAWAITEINTHQQPPMNILNALVREGKISEKAAERWKQSPPEDCEGQHFYADPF